MWQCLVLFSSVFLYLDGYLLISLRLWRPTCIWVETKTHVWKYSANAVYCLDPYEVNIKPEYHNDVIKWKHFPLYWPYVRGIHWSPMKSPHKDQWLGALMFSLNCAWINGRVDSREAGDLRRHCSHYDVIVMIINRPAKLQSRCTYWSLAVAPYLLNGLSNVLKDKMVAILADDIFNCFCVNESDRTPIQISLKYVPRSTIYNKPALVLSEPMLARFKEA